MLYEHSDAISKIIRNPWAGHTFCSASWDSSIQYWGFKEAVIEFISSINNAHKGPIYDLLWDTENSIISCGKDYMINQYDIRSKSKANTLIQGDCTCRSITKIESNSVAAAWDSGIITIMDNREPNKLLCKIVNV